MSDIAGVHQRGFQHFPGTSLNVYCEVYKQGKNRWHDAARAALDVRLHAQQTKICPSRPKRPERFAILHVHPYRKEKQPIYHVNVPRERVDRFRRRNNCGSTKGLMKPHFVEGHKNSRRVPFIAHTSATDGKEKHTPEGV